MLRKPWVATPLVALAMVLTACTSTPLDGDLPHPPPTSDPTSVPTPGPSDTPTAPGALVTVTSFLAFAGVDDGGATVSASGGIDDLLETGGTCTFAFTSGTERVEAISQGHTDATYTSCGVITEDVTQFSSGTWKVVLDYRSASAQGTSAPISFEVP